MLEPGPCRHRARIAPATLDVDDELAANSLDRLGIEARLRQRQAQQIERLLAVLRQCQQPTRESVTLMG